MEAHVFLAWLRMEQLAANEDRSAESFRPRKKLTFEVSFFLGPGITTNLLKLSDLFYLTLLLCILAVTFN